MEDLQKLGDLTDLIEDDFLELECEVSIEWEQQTQLVAEESKNKLPITVNGKRTTLRMSVVDQGIFNAL